MSRLSWRQRLIAVAVGGAIAALQAWAPASKAAPAHANATPAPTCAVKSVSNC